MKEYKYVKTPGNGEIIEQKSRFISVIQPVKTEDEAIEFINGIKKKYWDARHNCMAYIVGENGETKRFSDDGEPQGTAGKPILDILERNNVNNAVIVVTRYFGGILLGTGGLVRAYGKAAKEALLNCQLVERRNGIKFVMEVDYTAVGKIQYIMRQEEATEISTEYGEKVTLAALVQEETAKTFFEKITEATAGTVNILEQTQCYYGISKGKFIEII
jgi:uncharacterized YigZ family protein